MEEKWKPIESLFNKYYISDNGKITNKNGKILKTFRDKDGYECIRININNKSYNRKIHRLVAQAFINNPNNYPQVNHKNGIKYDNRVKNLEWCDQSYNTLHSMYVLGNTVKKVYQYDIYGNFIKEWKSSSIASKKYNCHPNNITKVCLGIHRTCAGYIWSYNKKLNINKLNFKKRYKIYQYDLNNNLIEIFPSIKEAREKTKINNISACCRKIQKSAGGYIWKYESDVI